MSWKHDEVSPGIHTFHSEFLTVTVVLWESEHDRAVITARSPRIGTTLVREFDAPEHWTAQLSVHSVEKSLDTPTQRV